MVTWIIGLSGAGKSTLANAVVKKFNSNKREVVLIDGDMVREIFGNDLGYSIEDRKKNANRVSRICKLLDDQNINVVCAILSIFPDSREWNRENISNYYEVYIEAPMEELQNRDYKGLYKKYNDGHIKDIAGLDIEFVEPKNSNLKIKNNMDLNHLLSYVNQIYDIYK
tara:strand:+ start:12417 stop:12920 length:504 start_codon:yes stop_codon:yes gene_type:complete